MDGVEGNPIARSWRLIDVWLAVHAPASLMLLNPPAEPAAVEEAERALGMPLPAELAASLRCHDGADEWTSLLPHQSPLSASAVAERYAACMDKARATGGFAVQPWADEPWWHPDWIPWAVNASGTPHVIDRRPGPHRGRLGWAAYAGGGDFTDGWPGLAAYLAAVARALHEGGGAGGMHPYLTVDGLLWWEFGDDRRSLNGDPLVPAPLGLEAP
ncbi:SMI1/KNR4 family protein [Actinomadura parmotrematis]|uniref:SMI1/KNR4 family protein n=1 Tax=Actinomadura parmotrematis TaxID=2864039 RepID=A0ABS7FLY0_9ACTN|nr:SMI1/KNR4 family protein [Actinomadura parmotrematis]MBW8481378.1 SMI1/KNR4 family protein [Actinomadura parmotrematis]